jgi:hypothetical protein
MPPHSCLAARSQRESSIIAAQANEANRPETPFVGLAPFLRLSIAGDDLRPIAGELLAATERDSNDPNLWMNLSIVMLCLELREVGLAIQAQALAQKRVYLLPASQQPASLRLLVLMVPGDIAANTPLDCLLEDCDVDLHYYYVTARNPFAEPIPEHGALFVAISECDENRAILASLADALADWPAPVINAPQCIPATGRIAASNILQNVPGLLIPPTLRASRSTLIAIADGSARLAAQFEGCDFPVIVRPVGSHGGHGLERINCPADIFTYLSTLSGDEFFLSRFVDYSGADGLFRKCRIALIDGVPFACHQAISSHWMIHYVNAGMYEDAWKRAEEARFMAHFADFALRHRPGLDAIYERTHLDYVCIDCAETRDGQLLIFEIDHAMVVHNMDSEPLFPYKQVQMKRVSAAFRDFLFRLTATRSTTTPP